MNKAKLIAIVGPTAVGKTNLSIALAKRLATQIISGDSMLVYRGLDIGTAKPTAAEKSEIVHHLIDILEPEREFSVIEFKTMAGELIETINKAQRIPILAGGTGLYVKSLVEDYKFNVTPGNLAYRQHLEYLAAERGKAYVHDLLEKVDFQAAARLHVNDFRRVIRALEVYQQGGEHISQAKQTLGALSYDAMVIGLTMERAHLYERINKRVDRMVEQGLVAEVAALLKRGLTVDNQSMQGIGYKEIIAYLQGDISLEIAIANIKQATRHFAKRQLTWFRKMPYIKWYDVESLGETELMEKVYNDIAGKFFVE